MGLVRRNAENLTPADTAELARIASRWRLPSVSLTSGSASFVRTVRDGAPATRRARGRPLFAGVATVQNRETLVQGLGPPADDADLVADLFDARGVSALAQLRGAFAFASWNEQTRELTLARDYGRGKSLFFHATPDYVVFASHLPDLLAHTAVPKQLDEVALARHLAHQYGQQRGTFFVGIERVPTRHAVVIGPRKIVHSVYWAPELRDEPLYRNDDDYIERARELLDQAVARSVGDSPNFAVMASGGLDSAALLATLCRQTTFEIACYTTVPETAADRIAPAGRYSDERPKTDALARMYPALRFQYRPASAYDPIADTSIFARGGYPTAGVSRSRFGARLRATIAADGYDVMLGGGAGNFGLTWHGADLLPALARQARFAALLHEARATARRERSWTGRVLVWELFVPSLPLAARQMIKRSRTEDLFAPYGSVPLRREIVAELDLARLWEEDGFDPLYAWGGSRARDRARWVFDQNQGQHDNFAASPTAIDAELRNPLGDRDLLEFAFNVPEHLYRRDGIPRWLARQLLSDRLPPEIVNEQRRGAQDLPWFQALSARRAELGAELEQMDHSLLASRLFDIPRLKRLVDHWPKDARDAEARGGAYMLALEQAVYVFQFMRWATQGNA